VRSGDFSLVLSFCGRKRKNNAYREAIQIISLPARAFSQDDMSP
jgi:hypothetical protein